jgi:hypothetical protein
LSKGLLKEGIFPRGIPMDQASENRSSYDVQ